LARKAVPEYPSHISKRSGFRELRCRVAPVNDRPVAYTVETQLALIRRDIEEIHHALHGDGKGRKGLVDQVEDLVTVADRGRFSLRVALWLGGGVVAAATALTQFKQAVLGLFHQ
jgi:hypothetical protein